MGQKQHRFEIRQSWVHSDHTLTDDLRKVSELSVCFPVTQRWFVSYRRPSGRVSPLFSKCKPTCALQVLRKWVRSPFFPLYLLPVLQLGPTKREISGTQLLLPLSLPPPSARSYIYIFCFWYNFVTHIEYIHSEWGVDTCAYQHLNPGLPLHSLPTSISEAILSH